MHNCPMPKATFLELAIQYENEIVCQLVMMTPATAIGRCWFHLTHSTHEQIDGTECGHHMGSFLYIPNLETAELPKWCT